MNKAHVDKVVDALLYEGYMLYPYRPSVKNRQRWTFGGLYPRAYCEAKDNGETWWMQTECLLQGSQHTALQVEVRFLHVQDRIVGALAAPVKELAEGDEPICRSVESLQVGDRLVQSWQEATERAVCLGELKCSTAPSEMHAEFAFPASRKCEPLRDPHDFFVGMITRVQQEISGIIEVSVTPIAGGLLKMRVRIENLTTLQSSDEDNRDAMLLRSLVSTHAVLGANEGEFVSLTDPPDSLRASAGGCNNVGAWPVLIGEVGQRDTLLASPIILYDYPQIASESPGDLFDATEIDEILTLRIMTLTEEEKQAAVETDERVRTLLRRTETLAKDQLLGLHGKVRGLRPVTGDIS